MFSDYKVSQTSAMTIDVLCNDLEHEIVVGFYIERYVLEHRHY